MNIRNRKLLGSFIVSLFSVLIFFPFQNTPAQQPDEQKKIRVGYYIFAGYHNFDRYGNRSGYGYDYLQEISTYTGWKYEYVGCTLNTCLQNLKNGEIDLLSHIQYSDDYAEIYDYSLESIGTSYGTLSVKSDNDTYSPGDYDSLNGMKVGILAGYNHNTQFNIFCQEHNLDITKVLFFDAGAMEKALQAGKVDGIVKSNFLKTADEKIIAQFDAKPFYFIVKKGNQDLLLQLNEALSQISLNDPEIKYRLYEKYYGSTRTALSLTKEEIAYLKNKRIIKAVTSPQQYPILWIEKGEYKGIFADIINSISKDLNVTVEIIPTNSYKESIQKIKNGEADIILDIEQDYSWAEENHVNLTSSYLSMPFSMITRNEKLPQNPSVAVLDGYYFSDRTIKTLYPSNRIVRYASAQEVFNAVSEGKQDIAYLNSYFVQGMMLDRKYRHLTSDFNNGFSSDISIGINENVEKILTVILNKEIGFLGENQIQAIVRQNTLYQAKPTNIVDLFYDHPIPVMLGGGIILLGIILILLLYSKSKINAEKQMENLAFGDELTGLKNIHWLEKNSHSILSADKKVRYALTSFDIIRFDIINECYGRDIGYAIIRHIAEGLKVYQSEGLIPVRAKADNFLCLRPYTTMENHRKWIDQLRRDFSNFQSPDANISVNMKFGVYVIAEDETEITGAIDNAETARHEAESNPASIFFYDDEMKDRLTMEKSIESIQDRALRDHEFQVYFQPKFDMRDNTMIGAEALVRWSSMDKGLMVPTQFVPLFEKNGFIIQLDFFVLEEVCKMIRRRLDSGQKIVPISVNQSRAHLTQNQYVKQLQDLFLKYDIPPKYIELELTETAFSDTAAAKEILLSMQEIGFLTSIDDFGSGYSSLTLLNDIPLDILKIDKYFLTKSDVSERTRLIIEKIVEMAKALNVQVICEGVENQQQIDFLLRVGCYFAQGYYYSKPLSQAVFENQLDQDYWKFSKSSNFRNGIY